MLTEPLVAVTGANGYVGSLIVEGLSAHTQVISLVRTPTKESDRLWHFDLTEREMADALRPLGITHIIHAAWQMQGGALEELRRTSVVSTERLLRAACACGTRFIFISTISAFE